MVSTFILPFILQTVKSSLGCVSYLSVKNGHIKQPYRYKSGSWVSAHPNSKAMMTKFLWNRCTKEICSSANSWADESLAKYQVDCTKNKDGSDFLSSPDNPREKRQRVAGEQRGAAALRAFKRDWNKSGVSTSWQSSILLIQLHIVWAESTSSFTVFDFKTSNTL